MNSKIIATGSYLPKKILTNDDLSKMVDTSDEWITERTGIKERHIARKDESTSDMAYHASVKAMEACCMRKEDVDMIVVATTTPDKTLPSTATILQNKLGIGERCFAFDVQAVCSGFVYALIIADQFIKTGQIKNALVVGADANSKIVDWKDRNTCVLFGDGAGAVVLTGTKDKNKGILASNLHSDGQYGDLLNTTGGVSTNQKAGYIAMQGREVYKLAVNKMADCVKDVLAKIGLTTQDIDWLVPHQANLRILEHVSKKLRIPKSKLILTVDKHANTSAASIPLALDHAVNNFKIKQGDLVVIEALGGGLTWGSAVIKW